MMEDDRDSLDEQTLRRSKKIKANDAIGTLRSGETTRRHIPQEIIQEILVRLPVKSLLRFKCIAKSWLALISSSKFIKIHIKYSTNLDPTLSNYRLLLSISYDLPRDNMSDCFVSFVLRDFWTGVPDDAHRFNNKTEQPFGIHGSCNGLFCISEYYNNILKDVFLWNPCLRMSKKLPPPLCAAEWSNIWLSRCCIGYDERNDDYKVVGLFPQHKFGSPLQFNKVEIYSLKNDSWKRIEDFKGGRLPRSFNMLYANGKIHFVEYCEAKYILSIVSLDLENEVYGTAELLEVEHQKCDHSSLSVGVFEGCIGALYSYAQDRADVWVLKEYGVKESWTKLVSIPYVDGPPSVNNLFHYHLLFMWNGKYLLRRGNQLVVYDAKDSSFVHRPLLKGSLGYIDSGGIYVESLVPLQEAKRRERNHAWDLCFVS